MFKYLVATGATLYCVLLVFGDEGRRAEVTRQAQDDVTGVSLAAFTLPETVIRTRLPGSGISETEAVKIAMDAGKAFRVDRRSAPLRGMVAATEAKAEAVAPQAQTAALHYVSGTRVNLRAGPGTGNAVVGQMVFGDAAEVIGTQDDWFQIRSADGTVAGWIFGKFLSAQKPI
jgi:hypothetical protein